MKKILVTGANSYIGKEFISFMNKYPGYQIDAVSVQNGDWKTIEFKAYDVVFHVAGIAHRKETKNIENLYYEVNTDLTIEIAKKAKDEKVNQFIYVSSMSVYGMTTGIITKETIPVPKSIYGKSKLKAEIELNQLKSEDFKICVLRPPMVYGPHCKGNFQSVIKLVRKLSFFPNIKNMRSMIYIENLCCFVKLAVEENFDGLFFPQNAEYMNTVEMAKWIAKSLDKKLYLSRILGLLILLTLPYFTIVEKAFGSLIYKDTEDFEFSYSKINNEESVKGSI